MGLMDNDPDKWATEARFGSKSKRKFLEEEASPKHLNTPPKQTVKRGPGDHISEGDLHLTVYGY